MKYIFFLLLKSSSYMAMGYLLYTLYNWNLEKFRKGNKESIFYKAKIISTKISLYCILFVLFLFTISSLWEAIEVLINRK